MSKLLQAAILMILIALAASCTVGKEYTTRVFSKQKPVADTTAVAVKFLEMDSVDNRKDMIVVTLPTTNETTETQPTEKPVEPTPKKDVARTKRSRD